MATPPPPPEDPFESVGNDASTDPFTSITAEEETINSAGPTVAAKPGRMLLVLGFVGTILAFLFYMIFGGKGKINDNELPELNTATQKITPPPLPAPAPTSAPPAFTPPSIPEPAKIPALKPEDDGADEKARLARLKSAMLAVNENNSGVFGNTEPAAAPAGNDPNSAFAAATAKANTKAERVEATRIGNLRRTIAQGRVIQATMESALNTELPAPIRAIVSRDVYGEAGNIPLIPKGSRLIGTYNTAIGAGQSRVFVVWTRVIRPDGVDVMINSPLVDQIGQAGIGGQVDSKFQEVFSRSVMASVVGIAFAIGTDKISGGQTATNNTAQGSTTTGDTSSVATVNALNRLGQTTDSFLQRLVGVNPSILVDQGTPVNVFVNRDLVFPSDYVGGGRLIE